MGRKKKIGDGEGDADRASDAATAQAAVAQAAFASSLLAGSGSALNPALLLLGAQAAAAASARNKVTATELSNKIDPDVQELCDHFNFDGRQAKKLSDLMKHRQDSFDGDMLKLWEKLEKAKSPHGLLAATMREMDDGSFIGKKGNKDLTRLVKKFDLDDEAESKLEDILARHTEEKRNEYFIDLEKHFEVSSRPSAMAMMLLKKLGNGDPLGKPGPAAKGSYVDRQHKSDRRRDDSRERGHKDDYRPRYEGRSGGGRRDEQKSRRDEPDYSRYGGRGDRSRSRSHSRTRRH